MENIKLEVDPIIHDTSLAEEFLKQNNYKFDFIPSDDYKYIEKKLIKDDVNNKVFVIQNRTYTWKFYTEIEDFVGNRGLLLEILQANAKLFAQLEFMIRNIPEDETMANLKLIFQYIQMPEKFRSTDKEFLVTSILFGGQFPLAVLGWAMTVNHGRYNLIVATQKTAAVATLFVQLCRDASCSFSLVFADEDEFKKNILEYKVLNSYYCTIVQDLYCTGVVTETADIDTALETFLSSFTKKPFIIKRVLVQENVYDSFKKSLEWKCRTSKFQQDISEEIKNMCSDVHKVDKKIFLLDYLGDVAITNNGGYILVEAYRTDSELLSLLKEHKTFGVSLWCNDVTAANKITYSTNASFTWINDYCCFEGPAELSQAFYSLIEHLSVDVKGKWLEVEQLIQKLENSTGILQELKEHLEIPSYRGVKNLSLTNEGLSIVIGDVADVVHVPTWFTSPEEVCKRVAVAAQLKRVILFDKIMNVTYEPLLNFMENLNLPIVKAKTNKAAGLYKVKCVWTRFPNKM